MITLMKFICNLRLDFPPLFDAPGHDSYVIENVFSISYFEWEIWDIKWHKSFIIISFSSFFFFKALEAFVNCFGWQHELLKCVKKDCPVLLSCLTLRGSSSHQTWAATELTRKSQNPRLVSLQVTLTADVQKYIQFEVYTQFLYRFLHR